MTADDIIVTTTLGSFIKCDPIVVS